MGKIVSLNISSEKGESKTPVEEISVIIDHGFEGDAHARDWHRQISLLAIESIDTMRSTDHSLKLNPGSFAENITTEGINLPKLPIGTRLISKEVELEVTQIGKKCHDKCNIFQTLGKCVMPKEGIFAKVITPGKLRINEEITIKK
jgi:MOSC domain-containing protein YiiM